MKPLRIIFGLIMTASVTFAEAPQTPVGLEGQITASLPPGTKVALQDARSDVLVQIVPGPTVGCNMQTTLRFWPMTAGDHDLRMNLVTSDGKPLTSISPLMVHGVSLLPPDWKGQLTSVKPSSMSSYGGYRKVCISVAAVWIVSLAPILLVGRHRRLASVPLPLPPAPTSSEIMLADLIAARAQLSPRDRHRLEMLLIRRWRAEHDLANQPIGIALNHLHTIPQTADSLNQLQIWLHAPEERSARIDTQILLAPFAKEKQ